MVTVLCLSAVAGFCCTNKQTPIKLGQLLGRKPGSLCIAVRGTSVWEWEHVLWGWPLMDLYVKESLRIYRHEGRCDKNWAGRGFV